MLRMLFIYCGFAMLALSVQQDLLEMPLAKTNYRCDGLTKLETDTGLVSDAADQLRKFAKTAVNAFVNNVYESGSYLPNQACQFLIAPKSGLVGPSGDRNIKFTFSKFELENGVDFLKFYSASSAQEDKLVKTLTGGVLPDVFYVQGPEVYVTFETNGNTQLSGFSFVYETPAAGQAIDKCDGAKTLLDDYGIISDGAEDYTASQYCTWTIKPDWTPASITLSFDTLDTESNYDSVSVYDANTGSLVFSESGPVAIPIVNILASSVKIVFEADTSSEKSGFRMSYCLNRPPPAPPPKNPLFQSNIFCNQKEVVKMSRTEGQIESGGQRPTGGSKGIKYHEYMKCQWLVQPQLTQEEVDQNAKFKGLLVDSLAVQLTIESMEIEAEYDFLKVYDGTSADPARLVAEVSGVWSAAFRPYEPIVANSGSMYIVFTTDEFTHSYGFTASYTVVPAKLSTPVPIPPSPNPSNPPTAEPWGNLVSIVSQETRQANEAPASMQSPLIVTQTFSLTSTGSANAVDGDASTCSRLQFTPADDGRQWWMSRLTNDANSFGDYGVHQVSFLEMPNRVEWDYLTPQRAGSNRATYNIWVGCPESYDDPGCVCTSGAQRTPAGTGACWNLCATSVQSWRAFGPWDFSITCQRVWNSNIYNYEVPSGRWLRIEMEGLKFAVPGALQLCQVEVMGGLRGTQLSCDAQGGCTTRPCPGWISSQSYDCAPGAVANSVAGTNVAATSGGAASEPGVTFGVAAGVCAACAVAVAAMFAATKYYKSRQQNVNNVVPIAKTADGPAEVPQKVDVAAKAPEDATETAPLDAKEMMPQQEAVACAGQKSKDPESWVLETVRTENM